MLRSRKPVAEIWEQIQLARWEASGERYQPTRLRSVRDRDSGVMKILEVPKRVEPWWWVTDTGKVCVSIRYGNKVPDLAEGKTSTEIVGVEGLVPALEAVRAAVAAGELDAQIEAASEPPHIRRKLQ